MPFDVRWYKSLIVGIKCIYRTSQFTCLCSISSEELVNRCNDIQMRNILLQNIWIYRIIWTATAIKTKFKAGNRYLVVNQVITKLSFQDVSRLIGTWHHHLFHIFIFITSNLHCFYCYFSIYKYTGSCDDVLHYNIL